MGNNKHIFFQMETSCLVFFFFVLILNANQWIMSPVSVFYFPNRFLENNGTNTSSAGQRSPSKLMCLHPETIEVPHEGACWCLGADKRGRCIFDCEPSGQLNQSPCFWEPLGMLSQRRRWEMNRLVLKKVNFLGNYHTIEWFCEK